MFDENTDLSQDLEWMLQSSQVDDDTLIDSLAHQYYQQIYNLALYLLTNQDEAHSAAQETFVLALIQADDYRGEEKIDAWLTNIFLGICNERKLNIEDHLLLNPTLVRSNGTRGTTEVLNPDQMEQTINEIKSEVQRKRAVQTNRSTYQVLGLISVVIIAVYLIVIFGSSWIPVTPTVTPASTHPISSEEVAAQIEDIPLSFRDPHNKSNPVEPLSINSDQDEIQDRIKYSRLIWNTLWAEIVVIFYGPSGYIGPPYSERHQVWIDNHRGGLLVSGPLQGYPDYIQNNMYPKDIAIPFRKFGSLIPWFSIKSYTLSKFPFTINYLIKPINQISQQDFIYSPVGEISWAGRDAVVVEQSTKDGKLHATLWLDAITGIILREQYYDLDSTGKVVIESYVSKIEFNRSIPLMWNRPDSSVLSTVQDLQEANINRKIPGEVPKSFSQHKNPRNIAPSQNDLSQSEITFFKSDHLDYDNDGAGALYVLANEYNIGEIVIANPLQMICDRSPDGSLIALSEWGLSPVDNNDSIYLIDLKQQKITDLHFPDTTIIRIGISPDNRQVAFSGYDELNTRFYLVDIGSGEQRQLPISFVARNISWSPEGNQIAVTDFGDILSYYYEPSIVQVYDMKSGEKITERQIPHISPGSTTVTIPMEGWVARFDLLLQDLTNCTTPP